MVQQRALAVLNGGELAQNAANRSRCQVWILTSFEPVQIVGVVRHRVERIHTPMWL